MLSSQVSNLRDLAPFVPGEQRTLPPEELVRFNSLLGQGSTQLQLGRPDSALKTLCAAAAIDSIRSGLQYLIGRCYDRLGSFATAREAYARARDDDMLRFRTSSDFNNTIAAAARTGGAFFVDMERAFAGASPDSLVGSTLILEHLHPNERGYFLMAREYARVMRAEEILAPGSAWKRADSLSEDSLWSHRGLTEHDIRCADLRIRTLMSGWPFQSAEATVPGVDPTDPFALLAQHVAQGELNWEQGHVAAAELFERRRDLTNARKEYRALIRMIPMNVSAYLLLGQTYLRTEELDSAAHILRTSLAVEVTSFACRTLASIEIDEGHPAEALPLLARAALLASGKEEQADIAFLEGVANDRLGKREMAVLKLEEALRLNPSSKRARQFLGKLTSQ
jgi:tetratricopeptide (TPR) repeat protein